MYPQFNSNNSPTQKIYNKINKNFNKIFHKEPMLSLNNLFNYNDLIKFDQRIKNKLKQNNIKYICELKIDGISVSIIYEKGILKTAATRGNGIFGEDITKNIFKIEKIPKNIPNIHSLEVRGEIYLSKNKFNKINENQKLYNLPIFSNPRNAAAGTIRQKNINIFNSRKLDYFIYYYINAIQNNIKTQEQVLLNLSKYGFEINKTWELCENIKEVWNYIQKWEKQRNNLPYEIDGIVIKINDLTSYNILGKTSKAPKWAIAYKFSAITGITKLLDIFPSVGRTGKITYNARLKPITISGTIITFATLHNSNYITNRDLRINDTVIVKKAGDIIPEVIAPVIADRKSNNVIFKKINNCPVCKNKLEQKESKIDQFCINIYCLSRILKSLVHFCSRNAMNIIGLKEKTLSRFLDLKLIKNISDIYNLINLRKKILSLPHFGEKSFTNIINSIILSKKNSLERLLFGLGINQVGHKISIILAKKYLTLENLIKASFNDLANIKEIGPIISFNIINFFSNANNQQLIINFKKYQINFNYLQIETSQILNNKIFVFTGNLTKNRNEFIKLLNNYGAKINSNISKNTSYLILGKNPGNKLLKARKLNIKIISEIELIKLLKEEKIYEKK